jgi:predicted nucleotidyltransferase
MFGLKDSTTHIIIKEISRFKEIQEAIIFGSRAKGNFNKGSDIDIALKGPTINQDIVTKLSRRLNQEVPIPYFVDVVHYEQIRNTDLLEHIDQVGKKLPLEKMFVQEKNGKL